MSDKRIEIDIAAAVALLQESPELCEVMNKLVGVPALNAALAEIELLRAERDALREALEPFKDIADNYAGNRVISPNTYPVTTTLGDCYRARAALAPPPAGREG